MPQIVPKRRKEESVDISEKVGSSLDSFIQSLVFRAHMHKSQLAFP
jgi:hypothetical protein